MENAIKILIEKIGQDYVYCFGPSERSEKFASELGYKINKKYIKVLGHNGSEVWGFVVNTDDDSMFRKGDILMAAGWKTPARNAARGNVLDGNFDWVQWTGPEYLID
jgi:hypothetical protein